MMKNGYDRYEVDDAISQRDLQISTLNTQLESNRMQMTHVTEQLMNIKQRYQTLISELSIREKAADDISRLALKEANRIIYTAQNNADSIVREALSTARIVLTDMAKLGKEATDMKAGMQEQLNVLLETLEEFELPPIASPERITK